MSTDPPDTAPSGDRKGMHLHWLTLRFSGPAAPVEAAYQTYFLAETLFQVRAAFLLGALLYGFFGLLDALVLGEQRQTAWLIRYLLVCPFILAVVGASFAAPLRPYLQALKTLTIAIGGLGIVLMIIVAPEPLNYYYYAGLILVLMFGYAFIYLPFLNASLAGWAIVLLYNVAALQNQTPVLEMTSNNFFLVSANVAGMLICYTIEYMGRKNFYLRHLLDQERLKIAEANDRLETRVAERTAAIEETNRRLSREMAEHERAEEERRRLAEQLKQAEKLETVGRLTAGVAHDLNNILSGLVTYPDLLLLDLPPESPWREPLSMIQLSGRRAAAIVQDLLNLARQGIAEKRILNLNQVVTDYLRSPEWLELQANHLQARLEVKLEEALLNLRGSPFQIAKVLMNLLHNACEANLVEGDVRVTTRNRYVDRPFDAYERIPEGEYVVLTVADTGIGIHPEDLRKIFEPFYSKKKLGRSGTGLGMTLIWSTVKDHGGFIDIASEEGRGTTFDLYFPATRDLQAQEATTLPIEACRGTERILVVDDVPEQRELAARMLGKLGYRVDVADSGETAVAWSRREAADLIVLDMIMDSGIDGCETYRRIAALRPGQRAVIASGFAASERVLEAQRLGAGPYLRKPYSLEEIARAVRHELDRAVAPAPDAGGEGIAS